MASKTLINLSNLQKFLSKLNEKFALKKTMKGISEDAEGNIIIGEEGLVPTPNENSKGKFLRSDGEWALPSETAVYDSMTIEEGVAGVSEVDKVLNAKNLKQIVNSDGFLTSLDSSKLTGVINIENLPQGALERILIVSSKEERLTLSDTEVQLGDVVKETDTGLMYYVINIEKLNSEEGYTQFTAGMASSVPWSGVTDKPTIPTKTSDLTNDSNFAIDSNVVHKSGNETIEGIKTFTKGTWVINNSTTSGYSIKNTAIARNEVPSQLYHATFRAYDKNDKILGEYCVEKSTTGCTLLNMNVRSEDSNGKQLSESLCLNMSNDGSAVRFYPSSNNKVDLGMSNYKWGKIYSDDVVHTSGTETITGSKTFSNQMYLGGGGTSYGLISAKDNNSILRLFGGTSAGTGANLDLYGEGLNSGGFSLRARTSDKIIGLDGKVDGTLKWDGKNIALDENLVHRSGDETIDGIKTFTSILKISQGTLQVGSDTGHSVTYSWNGDIISKQPSGTYNIALPKANGTLALDENLVHRSGDETIAGNKTFTDKVVCTRFTHSVNNDSVYITGGTEYDKGATLVLHGEESSDAGSFIVNARDKTRSLYLVGKPDGTLQWAGQDIALDENLVHRSGDETIAGNKTFSNRISFPSGYYLTTDTNDNSLRIIRDGTGHGNNYKIIIQGDTGKIFAPNGFIGNLQGNADSSTKATQDSAGQQINKTYIKELSVSGRTITYKRGDNTTGTITTQDTNTTYSKLSQFTNDCGFITSSGSCAYADSAGSANSVAWANVTGKPNIPTTPNVYVTATWGSGSNWYRKWSNGFIEQGGFTDCTNAPDHMVVATNLPLAFSNANYTLLVQITRGTASGKTWGTDYSLPTTRSKTTTRFEVYSNDIGYPGTNGGGYDWYACGY